MLLLLGSITSIFYLDNIAFDSISYHGILICGKIAFIFLMSIFIDPFFCSFITCLAIFSEDSD